MWNKFVIASVNSAEKDKLPIIALQIFGLKVDTLLDSGAAVSLLSPEVLEALKQTDAKIKYLANRVTIHTFDNSVIPFRQCIKITFKINNEFVTGTFYVTSHNFQGDYKMLLGFDFLKKNRMILNFDKKTLKLKNTEIALEPQVMNKEIVSVNSVNKRGSEMKNITKAVRTNKIKCHFKGNEIFACIEKETHLHPGQTKIISLRCPEAVQPNQLILIEPTEEFKNLITECSIHEVPVTNKINLIVTNNTEDKIIIRTDTRIALISSDFVSKNNLKPNEIEDGEIYQINNLDLQEVRALREAELDRSDFNLDHLTGDFKQKIEDLLMSHAHAFSKSYKSLGQSSLVVPKIQLNHNFPIQHKPYKTPQAVKQYAQEELRKLLEAKIIEKSDSDYAFPVLFVKKKGTEKNLVRYRMAVDYRTLNEILEGFPYPVPDVKDVLQAISGKKFYTTLDLHSAFFQIILRPEDRHKLAFVTECGKYAPCRLNFGLKLSSTKFAELMDRVLGHFPKDKVGYFIDDVVLAEDTPEGMAQLLKEVLETLIDHNLTVEPSKVQICKPEIEFLGFKVNKNGYAPSEKNVGKVQRLTRPKNKKGVKSLLGLANYFRTLIQNYADIVNPLVELTKQNVKFKWTEETEQAFLNIQEAIVSNPTLKPPKFDREFFLITDGSKKAISGVLAQEDNGYLVPIEFYGRKLKQSETAYPSMKFELLAIHDAVMHFKHMLLGRKFTILTDNKALTYPLKIEMQSDIVARWILNLSDYDYNIEYIEGKINPSDFLSRNLVNNITSSNELQNNLFKVNLNLSEENIRAKQYEDEKLITIIKKVESKKNNRITKKYNLNENKTLVLKQNGKYPELIIVPDELKFTVMAEAHGPHFGFKKTYETVKTRLFWYGMYQDIKNYCTNCVRCNCSKQHQTIKVPLEKMERNLQIGASLQMDIVGKLPMTLRKNCFILTIIDAGSRFLEAVPLRNVESQTILNVLNRYFGAYGLCSEIVTDNAQYFRSALFKEYLKTLNIDLHPTSVYKPCGNGLAEIINKSIKASLVAMSNSTLEWDTRLEYFKLNYNTTIHRALGYSPSKLFFGREIKNQFTVLSAPDLTCTQAFVKNRIEHMRAVHRQAIANQQKIMAEYIKENDLQEVKKLDVGQEVYAKVIGKPRALHPRFEGPFVVVKVVRHNNYVLRLKDKINGPTIRRHIQFLFAPKATTRNARKTKGELNESDSEQNIED